MDEGSEIAMFFYFLGLLLFLLFLFFLFSHHLILFPSLRLFHSPSSFVVDSLSWVPFWIPFTFLPVIIYYTTKTAIRKDIVFSGTPRFRGRSRGSSLA